MAHARQNTLMGSLKPQSCFSLDALQTAAIHSIISTVAAVDGIPGVWANDSHIIPDTEKIIVAKCSSDVGEGVAGLGIALCGRLNAAAES